MDERQKEAWMLGCQEGYSKGYDDGYEKGLQDGAGKGRNIGRQWLDFIKVQCACGSIIPYPVIKTALSTEFQMPEEKQRRCFYCGTTIPDSVFIKAYLGYGRGHGR